MALVGVLLKTNEKKLKFKNAPCFVYINGQVYKLIIVYSSDLMDLKLYLNKTSINN